MDEEEEEEETCDTRNLAVFSLFRAVRRVFALSNNRSVIDVYVNSMQYMHHSYALMKVRI